MSGPGSRILLYRVKSCWGLQSLRIVCCFSGYSAFCRIEKSCADFRFKTAKLAILIIQLSSLDISIRHGKVAGTGSDDSGGFEKDTRSYRMTRYPEDHLPHQMITPGSYRPVITQPKGRIRETCTVLFHQLSITGGFAIRK